MPISEYVFIFYYLLSGKLQSILTDTISNTAFAIGSDYITLHTLNIVYYK